MTDVTEGEAPILSVYLSALDPPDIRAARLIATEALDSGMTSAQLIDTVLRPAQEEIGRRWQNNECSVAQEHAATAITDSVLALSSLRNPQADSNQATVVGGCVEGEWHTLPLRMLSSTLVASGLDVTFLGPSLPGAQFARSLNDIQPTVALLSCTTPINLPGARRTVEVAHQAGVSVIIGGRALDPDGVRAAAVGADACAANAAGAASILDAWDVGQPAHARAADLCPEGAELEIPQPGLVADCLGELFQRQPRLREMSAAQLDRTREDIAYILQFCAAALITQDHTVLDDFTIWLRDLLAVRGVPAGTIQMSYECIAAVLGGGFPKTTTMLDAAANLI
ncbi:MAG: cobalamin-dependent protein [Ilumatobacteraceae bacterium]